MLDTFRKKVNAYTFHDTSCNEHDDNTLVRLLGVFDYSHNKVINLICSFCNARHINPMGSQGAAV